LKDYTNALNYYEHIMRFLIEWEQGYSKTKKDPAPYENWYYIYAGRDYACTYSKEKYHIKIKLLTDYGENVLESWKMTNSKIEKEKIEQFESFGFKQEEEYFSTEILLDFGKVNESEITQKIKKINEQFSEANITVYEPKSSGGCYVATAVYGSYDCPEVWTLRRFRDKTLAGTCFGRLFIRFYYAVSPTAVKYFGNTKLFKNLFRKPLDKFVNFLNRKGFEDTPYYDKQEETK